MPGYPCSAMPIYEYRCENGHSFEVMQRMADDPIAVCQTCDASVRRVFHPVAVHFKGSGFYNTDYGTRKRSQELETSANEGADKTDAKSKDGKKAEEKTGAGSSSSSGSGEKAGGSQGSDGKATPTESKSQR